VLDAGDDPSAGGFLVFEDVGGEPLTTRLARVVRLTPSETMALVADVAEALAAVHGGGMVHRDVQPGTIVLRSDGPPVLGPPSIVRLPTIDQLGRSDATGQWAWYGSPEAACGEVGDARSDLFSLGMVAHHCLTGRIPFHDGRGPLAVAMAIVRDPTSPLPVDVPPEVAGIVTRAMAKRPDERWPDAASLAQAARAQAT
jgi:serine/threonine-protein kinase